MENWIIQPEYRWLAHLFEYPDDDWMKQFPTLQNDIDSLPNELMKADVMSFFDGVQAMGKQNLVDHYVQIFDFGKNTNLYMTYADYGEERERGPALLELKQKYEKAGFSFIYHEMPDYLPLILEFCACSDRTTSFELLHSFKQRLDSLHESLMQINSPYAFLVQAVRNDVNEAEVKR